MAQLFFDPRGAAVTIGTKDAGQASAASFKLMRETMKYGEWDSSNCIKQESAPYLMGLKGELTLSMLGAADVELIAIALFGTGSSSAMNIGDSSTTEFEITVVVTNVATSCGTWTYNFPRCQLADEQEHIFGAPHDATEPVQQALSFVVLPADGTAILGTITKA
jgi:hypothetical protein